MMEDNKDYFVPLATKLINEVRQKRTFFWSISLRDTMTFTQTGSGQTQRKENSIKRAACFAQFGDVLSAATFHFYAFNSYQLSVGRGVSTTALKQGNLSQLWSKDQLQVRAATTLRSCPSCKIR